jgi:glutamate carboxypeptidase
MKKALPFGLLLLAAAPALAAPPPAQIRKAAEAVRPAQLDLLRRIVDIDSGTGDAAGAAKIQAILADELKAIGATIEMVPAEAPGLGDNLIARLTGTGKGRLLLIAHIDTVFGPGTVADRSFKIEGDHVTGPGVSDEKGGVVEAVTALKLLHALKQTGYKSITLLIETSEEQGSPGTRGLIATLLKDADVELNMEPGDAPDALTVWRKGSSGIKIVVHGRAAHAGVSPQDGRNAAIELIHQLKTVEKFPQTGDGVTVNLTTLKAGDRANVIPDLASADINIRIRKMDQLAPIIAAFQESAKTTIVPDTKVQVVTSSSYPPLADNPATMALAEQAKRIYAATGRTITFAGNGGASESAMAAAAGVPALDGLGPVGGGFHSTREFVDLSTVTPRLYMLTQLLIELGANPPARAR